MEGIEQHVLQTHFGAFLKMHRDQWSVRQREVLFYLPGWTQANYSRLESGVIAPSFDQLLPIYRALLQAGVHWNAADRRQFFTLARTRLEGKKNRPDYHPDSEWEELRYQVADLDFFPDEPAGSTTPWTPPRPLLAETRHLVGREDWHAALIGAVQSSAPKKLLVLQGPVGIGKSSELHRLIQHFIHAADPAYHIIWVPLLPPERGAGPESSLDIVLGNILAERGSPALAPEQASWEQRQRLALALLEQSDRPVMILVDNAESALTEGGILAACWEEFLVHFLRYQHKATLILATKEWPGWSGRDRAFVYETNVPPLDTATSILLLQQQGLEAVSVEQLQEVSTRVGGIPLYLEWVASLVQNPHQLSQWQSFDVVGEQDGRVETGGKEEEEIVRRLTRLLAEPTLLRGHLANKLRPLLERLVDRRLSAEARSLLQHLTVCNVPLGKTALQTLCEHPGPINELRNASLLVAYAHRVQVLPIVASVVVQGLTAEWVGELEERVIDALKQWIDEGTMNTQEAGNVMTELAMLLLKHHRLLDAAQLLIRYGWLGFHLGSAPQIASFAEEMMYSFNWHITEENECGGLLLQYFLPPFLGKTMSVKQRVIDYQRIRKALFEGKIVLQSPIEVAITYHLMIYNMNDLQFEEAQALFETCYERLAPLAKFNVDLQASLFEKHSWLCGRWSEYFEEQGEIERAKELQEQAITLCTQIITLISNYQEVAHLKAYTLKKRLARAYNNLGYFLNRIGQYSEALHAIENSIALKERGYAEIDTLADAYGEKSQILAELGRFREALLFDEKAIAEVQRLIEAGYAFGRDELWMHLVNRGRLYLRLGKIDEAEQLLLEALPHISAGRRMYSMFAEDALNEIEQWRKAKASHYQLDWRWVERYRELASFDSYWWLTSTGPFTEEEQQQWNHSFTSTLDEKTKEQLGKLLSQSQEREVFAAITQLREPQLHYPTIDIEEVRSRIAGLTQLDTEVTRGEPNAIVRRLYHETIEEEKWFLRLIEATFEGSNEQFWNYNLLLNPLPSPEEMHYTLSRVRRIILQGLLHPETVEASQQVVQYLLEQFHLSLDLSYTDQEAQELLNELPLTPTQPRYTLTVQAAKRFFEEALRQGGYDGWQVIIDPNANVPRVEQGLRHLYLPESTLSVNQIKDYLSHELAGHIARCVTGANSLIGLLGIHTKNSLETEEGLATYYEIQTAASQGLPHDETGIWLGTLATGLASGVITAPQTFLSLFQFFEKFIFLYRLLKRPEQNVQTAARVARRFALARCIRTFRGVPNLEKAGICYSKDAHYLRGLQKIKQAMTQDTTVLDRLAVGVVALDRLPDFQELGIVSVHQPLRDLVSDPDLDSYILSFNHSE